jgi:hypothetical protein
VRLASVSRGDRVELSWAGMEVARDPIETINNKVEYAALRKECVWRRRGRQTPEKELKDDLRSAQLGWVIPPGGSRLGPPQKRGGGGNQPS